MIGSKVATQTRHAFSWMAVLGFLLGVCVGRGEEALRKFTNTDGVVIEAQLVEVIGESAVLLWQGKEVEVSLAKLSEVDRNWVEEWQKNKMSPAGGDEGGTSAAPGKVDPRAGQTLTFEFPELIKDMSGAAAKFSVKVPSGFDGKTLMPLFVFLAGGNGSSSPGGAAGLTNDDFLCVGLPYPDDGRNPDQNNMVGSFDEVWAYWQPMLAKLDEEFPNIDKRLRMIGGFSNGGHAIDGLLGETAFGEYFTAFVLIDGGGALGGKYRSAKGEHCYIAWGEKSPNAANSEEVVSRARRAGMELVASEMVGVGHAFPDSEKNKVTDWIYRTVVPALAAGGAE